MKFINYKLAKVITVQKKRTQKEANILAIEYASRAEILAPLLYLWTKIHFNIFCFSLL